MTIFSTSRRRAIPAVLCALSLVAGAAHASGSSFNDSFDSATGRWWAANGWSNGAPFAVGWRADQVNISGGALNLTLGACPGGPANCSGMALAGAEYRTSDFYGYGRYSTNMQAATGSGVVTGFFTYTGPSDGKPWDEIDVEILGKDPSKLQVNYFVNGVGGNEHVIDLGFDASAGLHSYAFDWSASALRWYVDGAEVYSVLGSAGTALPTHTGRLISNLWVVDSSASGWAGSFAAGTTANARFDSISYSTPAPVPEPASVVMLAGGLGLLALRGRRVRPVSR
jgi:beta-glucanase (GH16 family)